MTDSGLRRFLGNGIRFATSAAASLYVGLKLAADPSSSFDIKLLTSLPSSGTEILTIDNTGQIGRTASGGGGTVSSVALSLPSIFSVAGSPVTTSGTLSATLVSQTQNTVWAAPDGSNGAPTFRALVANDIPSLTASKISNFDTQVRTSRLDQMASPTASVSFNSQRITNLLDPTSAQDAATKAYVDAISQGLDVKTSVRAASTSNITISNPGTSIFDGVTLSNGDRVLLKDQTTGSQNGIYIFNGSGSALTRSTDADTSAKVTAGLYTFVSEGTTNGNNGFALTTDDPITLGTTALVFTQFSGAGQITAGAGLTKTGNQLDVVGTANRIVANADSIDIDSAYAGQTSIVTLGTVTTGIWNGTTIAVARGGTGATDAATARTNLSASGVYRTTFNNASLSSGILTVTHSLGNKIVRVQISDNNDKVIEPDDITLTSSTQSTVDLTSWGTLSGTWNVLVLG